MRTLILSCNTGEGHNSCAKAIKEVFDLEGETCAIADALCFLSKGVSHFVSLCHVGMYRYIPRLFQFGYEYSKSHPGVFEDHSGIYKLITLGSKKLYQFIVDGEYDTVICTHVFAALIMTNIKKKYSMEIDTYFVATDYICNPGTKGSCLDYYFIPDRIFEEEYVCSGITSEKLVVSGIPIRQDFYGRTNKEDAKRRYGICTENKHLLMMCGSMGCGPMVCLAKLLAEKMKLEKEFTGKKNIRIMGYVQDMSPLLDSVDLYLTKPGGVSISEATAKSLPMVFVNAVAGCEEYNRKYFMNKGCAATADTVEKLVTLSISLLENDVQRENMKKSFQKVGQNNAAQRIYDFIRERKASEDRKAGC